MGHAQDGWPTDAIDMETLCLHNSTVKDRYRYAIMNVTHLILSFLAALIGSAVATGTGFGAATILTPVLAFFIDLRQAIVVVAIFHAIHNAIKFAVFRRGIHWGVALLFGPGAIVFSIVGGLLSSFAPVALLQIALGAFLVFDGVTGLSGRAESESGMQKHSKAVLGGALSGLVAGIIGTGGAMRAMFLHHFLREKTAYIATSAFIALLIDASRIPVYWTQYPKTATSGVVPLILVSISGAFLGVIAAWQLLKHVSTQWFRKVVLAALVVAGIALIGGGLHGAFSI